MYKSIVFIFATIFLTFASSELRAEEQKNGDDKGIFSVVVENDVFTGSDRDYTNGIRFSWLSAEENMPTWTRSIAHTLSLANKGKKRISIAAGQSMFTPEDIRLNDPPAGSRPYAGWLYGSVGMISDTGKKLDNVMLTLGVVGSLSYAEQTQKFVHNIIDSPHPEGWDHQLNNEPGIILTYERKRRGIYEFSPLGFAADVTPHMGVNLGNINTDASLGATFRLGYDLPADYGPPRIRPSLPGSDFFIPTKDFGGYLFTTVGGRAIARDIFLDGNTFGSDSDVDKKSLVGSLQVGAAVTYGPVRLSYTQVMMTREYDTQKNNAEFGVLTLSCRF